MSMRVLDAGSIAARSSHWEPLVDAAASSLVALSRGDGHAPLRTSVPLIDGQLLTMPGCLPGSRLAVVKLVTAVPGNAAVGRPTIQGTVLAFDAETGSLAAQLDGPALTAVRTAAISAAAARALVATDTLVLALIGAGAQAPWQVRAVASVLRLREVRVWAPANRNRERLAGMLSEELGITVRAVDTLERATAGAGIVCCSTTASQPFLEAGYLTESPVLVVAIGAYRPDMGEVAPSVFAEAGRVYVDDKTAVLQEGGDVLGAIGAGVIGEADVIPVGAVIAGGHRPADSVVVFKSVGSALEDAAITETLLER